MLTFLLAVLWTAIGLADRSQSASELITEGFRLLERRQIEPARLQFERALLRAVEDKDTRAEAGARYGLGKVFIEKAQYPAAREQLELALALCRAAGDRLAAGRLYADLGFVAWAIGDRTQAGALYREALAEFEAAGDLREQASVLYSLTFTVHAKEQEPLLQRALDLARQLGDKRLEGLVLHKWGDGDFVLGEAAAAGEKLERAAELLSEAGARRELARVLTSLGRLYRFHGHPDRALQVYQRALRIQEELGDRLGIIQSIDTVAIAYQAMGEYRQALEHHKRALALARETGSPGIISRQLHRLATSHIGVGEFALAVPLLEESIRLASQPAGRAFLDLSLAYAGMGRHRQALEASEKAVELAGTDTPSPENLAESLMSRARAKDKLGRSTEALADARAALDAIENLRVSLVPSDFMKRGFAERYRELFTFLIETQYRLARHDEALETAERGRARAFLDLLATREIEPARFGRARLTEARELERRLQATEGGSAGKTPLTPVPLTVRGNPEIAELQQKWRSMDPELKSLVSARPFSAAEVMAAAARLESTVVAYWVSPEATFIWVAGQSGPVHSVRVAEGGAARLRRLIEQTLPAQIAGAQSTIRGAGSIHADESARDAWRGLYGLLIRPVRRWLPGGTGRRLTIIPHGPLFRTSFAALLDERDRYLVERYSLHYVPAAAVLEFTEKRKRQVAGNPARYLLIADPIDMPPSPAGSPLPRLPGSRREVMEIARRVPPSAVSILTGDRVREETVLSDTHDKTVIHFATHGVLRDDQPLDSFLALSSGGRLTAQEIYGLELNADLVVLSACRTALGQMSGDGVVGLTRAFFYAGASSVLATLWDVADEPTALLVSDFYRYLQQYRDKARALRAAQIGLLGALRRGEVKVDTAAGSFTLPEHPVFWAGFVLQGEP